MSIIFSTGTLWSIFGLKFDTVWFSVLELVFRINPRILSSEGNKFDFESEN